MLILVVVVVLTDRAQYNTLSDRIREWQPEQNGLQFSAEDGKRRRVSILRLSVMQQTDELT